jgi:hypothetical protein
LCETAKIKLLFLPAFFKSFFFFVLKHFTFFPVFRNFCFNLTKINPDIVMKRLVPILLVISNTVFLNGQKADFKAAEKFRGDNLTPKYGDLFIVPNWIEESDIFWYTFKSPSGRNFYYVNAASKTKRLMFDSRFMAAEIRKLTYKPCNELDLPLKVQQSSLS